MEKRFLRPSPAFSTFMDTVVNKRGAVFRDNLRMRKGKYRHDRVQEAAKLFGAFTPAGFAKLVKGKPQVSYKWWHGQTKNISAADLLHIADALKVSPRWLMDLSPNREKAVDLSPNQQSVLALYGELLRVGGEWAEDWVAEGNRLLKKLGATVE